MDLTCQEFENSHAMALQAEKKAFAENELDDRADLLTLAEQAKWMADPASKDDELDAFRFETQEEREEKGRQGKY